MTSNMSSYVYELRLKFTQQLCSESIAVDGISVSPGR